MTESTSKPQLQIVEVTRSDYESGHAFDHWKGDSQFARLGGEFAELLLTSPVREAAADDPLLLTAMIDNQPVGYINTFNGVLHAGSTPVDMLWCSGLSVLPEHRNTGAGLMILLRLRSRPVASGAVGVSQVALPIYRQLGWHDLAADRHLLVRRSAPILRRWLQHDWLLKPAALLANIALALQRFALAGWLRIRFSGFQVEEVTELPAELDSKLSALQRPLKCHRSTTWVNWAMRTGPQRNGRRLYLVKNSTGEAMGYFMTGILHHEEADGGRIRDIRLASVRDWMSFDPSLDDTGVLLLGLRELLGADADAIELCVPEADSGAALRRLGLLRKGALHMVLRLPADTPGIDESEIDRRNVWFRPADGDGFVN